MIAFGTGGSIFKNEKLLKDGLKEYINLGGTIIDSAEKYNSGIIIKNFIQRNNRNKFYIISKIRPHQYKQKYIFNVIKNKILKDLNTDYLDELVIHSAFEEKYEQDRINT
jgi:diketogulonate reductase-like aldo/keto reductase